MKILLTGFDPFGGESINPSYEAVRSLPRAIKGAELVLVELPTVFRKSIDVLIDSIKIHQPDLVLCIGQAGGRYELTLERVAINVDDARIPDNEGNQPIDQPIAMDGAAAYFSSLPVKTMIAAAREHNIPAALSNSAGTFVCNHIMYGLLHYIYSNSLNIPAGFLHVPYLPEQIITKRELPYMPLDMIQTGILCMLEAAVRTIAEGRDDLRFSEGRLD